MRIASLNNVTTHYGAQPVLKGASLEVNSQQKLGLIGANGSGKTTILRVLLGRESVTGGTAYLEPGVKVGYVPQHVEHDTDATVIDWLLAEYKPLADALRAQEKSLARSSAVDMNKAMRAYQEARDAYEPHRWRRLAEKGPDSPRRLRTRGQGGAAPRLTVWRREERPVAGAGALVGARPAPPRRACESSGLPRRSLAGELSNQVQGGGPDRLAQPLPAGPSCRWDTGVGERPRQCLRWGILGLPQRQAPPPDRAAARLRRQPEAAGPARGAGEAIRADREIESRPGLGQASPCPQVAAGAREAPSRGQARVEPEGHQRRFHDGGGAG